MFRDYLLDYFGSATVPPVADGKTVQLGAGFDADKIEDHQLPKNPLGTLEAIGVAVAMAAVLSAILYYYQTKKTKANATAAEKGLGALYLAVFLDSLGAFSVLPFMGALIVIYGCTAFQSSCLAGSFAFTQFIGSGILGYLADRMDRRVILLWTLGVCALCLGMGGISMQLPRRFHLETMTAEPFDPNGRTDRATAGDGINVAYWALLITRAFAGFFASTVSVIQTMVAEISPEEVRTQNIAMVMGFFALGMIGGPIIGGLCYDWGIATLCYASGSITLVNVGYAYLTLDTSAFQKKKEEEKVEEKKAVKGEGEAVEPVKVEEPEKASPFKDACASLVQHPFTFVLLISTFFATGAPAMFINGAGLFNLQIYKWNGTMIGAMTALAGMIMVVAQMKLTGPIIGSLGDVKAIILGNFLRVVTMTLYVTIINPVMPWILFPCGVVAAVCIDAPLQSLMSKYSPQQSMGTMLGFMQSLRCLGEAVCPPLSGWLADQDMTWPMRAGAVMAAICGLLFVGFTHK